MCGIICYKSNDPAMLRYVYIIIEVGSTLVNFVKVGAYVNGASSDAAMACKQRIA